MCVRSLPQGQRNEHELAEFKRMVREYAVRDFIAEGQLEHDAATGQGASSSSTPTPSFNK